MVCGTNGCRYTLQTQNLLPVVLIDANQMLAHHDHPNDAIPRQITLHALHAVIVRRKRRLRNGPQSTTTKFHKTNNWIEIPMRIRLKISRFA